MKKTSKKLPQLSREETSKPFFHKDRSKLFFPQTPKIQSAFFDSSIIQRQTDRAFAALTLSHIACSIPDDYFGDEIYINVNGSRVWGPTSMNTDDVKPINRQIPFSSGHLEVRVYDEEISTDDLIGSVRIPKPESEEEIRRAPHRATLNVNGWYTLYFQVHRI